MVKGLDNLLSVRVDFNFADPCYVLQLAAAQHGAADATLAAALSNNVIKLYHHHVADLQQISSLEGHSDRITDVHVPLHTPSIVLSSSDDGTVRVWDSRSASEAERCALCFAQ
jgi:WD40 repeat protein